MTACTALPGRLAAAVLGVALSFCLCACAEAADRSAQPALGPEMDAVVAEIHRMIETDVNDTPAFRVREATPERIEKLFSMPQVTQLPRKVRENGLIFAGLGSSLLTFEKPSDIIAKVASWFPREVALARGDTERGRFFGQLHLWGPFEHWQPEAIAFMSLWNCMPQNAWLKPDRNPFERRLSDSVPLYPIAARQSSYEEFDFGHCVRLRSGERAAFTMDVYRKVQQVVREMGDTATPVLRGKFARFLQHDRCRGTGPDDCVLVLRLWVSLTPADAELAAALQALEAEVAPDAPLPPLQNPNAGWAQSKPEDGQQRFDAALRIAAFLRAKLQSVLAAPAAWPADALPATLRQLSSLRAVFAVPYVHRWYMYELDYRNDPINPWRIIDAERNAAEPLRSAILAELQRHAADGDCSVLKQWLGHVDASLQTEYVLGRLRSHGAELPRCGQPDFAWLRQQERGEFRYLLYGYLALLQHLPAQTSQPLLEGLTSGGEECSGKNAGASAGWQKQICERWRVHRPRSEG